MRDETNESKANLGDGRFTATIGTDGYVTIKADPNDVGQVLTKIRGPALRDIVADAVREGIATSAGSGSRTPPSGPLTDDTIIDQTSGLVPRRLYLRLARAGVFPSRKVGRRVCCRLGDLRGYFRSTGKPLDERSDKKPGHDPLDDLRRSIGLVPKGK